MDEKINPLQFTLYIMKNHYYSMNSLFLTISNKFCGIVETMKASLNYFTKLSNENDYLNQPLT